MKVNKTPSWAKGKIVYHIFVDRFFRERLLYKNDDIVIRNDWGGIPEFHSNKNNDFFGGNLEGIIKKIPYLKDLGVDIIYLSPIFKAYSNHKYDTSDYFSIDEMFGTITDLSNLCHIAKENNMKVIIDGVFNHTGADSIYFNKYGKFNSLGAFQSKNSPYYKWYNFREDGSYDCWWSVDTLPQVNELEPSYMEFIKSVLEFWFAHGISGIRLDVADELPNQFIKFLRNVIKNKGEHLIIGEVWENAVTKEAYGEKKDYFDGNKLDSVTNYPLKNAIIEFINKNNSTYLYETMEELTQMYPKENLDVTLNILSTHDTIRIIDELALVNLPYSKEEQSKFKLSFEEKEQAKKKLKLASLLQFTLPGIPCIYYGDEIAQEGLRDPFNRMCYTWENQDTEMIDWYKHLANIRKENEVFIDGAYKNLSYGENKFSFIRYNNEKSVKITIENGDFLIEYN